MDCGDSEGGITDKISCFKFNVEVKLELDNISGQITGFQDFPETRLLVDQLLLFFFSFIII